jgi:hypothetical protein
MDMLHPIVKGIKIVEFKLFYKEENQFMREHIPKFIY